MRCRQNPVSGDDGSSTDMAARFHPDVHLPRPCPVSRLASSYDASSNKRPSTFCRSVNTWVSHFRQWIESWKETPPFLIGLWAQRAAGHRRGNANLHLVLRENEKISTLSVTCWDEEDTCVFKRLTVRTRVTQINTQNMYRCRCSDMFLIIINITVFRRLGIV